MAELSCKGSVFSTCRCRDSSIYLRRARPLIASFFRLPIEPGRSLPQLKGSFLGKKLAIPRLKGKIANRDVHTVPTKMALLIGKAMRWWEKEVRSNMKEITSAQDLVDSLMLAGDSLVVVDFFSPGCGGCKALHPKISQFAERNPDVLFLLVNHEKHKSMCYSLNVHVLPFFKFYRGAHGRLCSFSCTNATINKFKDALAKHNTDRCSLGPAKGLEETELLALAANKDLCFNYTKKEEATFKFPEAMEPVLAISALSFTSSSNHLSV